MKKIISALCICVLLMGAVCTAETLQEILPSDFLFASGAGGWGTELTLNEDMSFKGSYSDSEMGDIGEGYEYGSYYVCDFTGSFSEPVVQDNGTATLTVNALSFANEPGGESIEDNIRYVYEEAYGICEGDEFIYYPSGFATADMDESAVEWAALCCAWGDDIPETLTEGVLYNITQGYSFVRQSFDN